MQDNTSDPRWQALKRRDPTASFLYAVTTTGIYCRVTCGARLPKPQHVRFYATSAQAKAHGFRACKRCQPDVTSPPDTSAALVEEACLVIQHAQLTLSQLARQLGVSASHLQRVFKASTGLTPKAYGNALRSGRVRAQLKQGAPVTEALYQAGYGSSSRFYEKAGARLGMRPKQFIRGGENMDIEYAVAKCQLGYVLAASTSQGICAVMLGDTPEFLTQELKSDFPQANLQPGGEQFKKTMAEIVRLADNPSCAVDLPLHIKGTAFQERVWQALRQVPAGQTCSYSDIAQQIGNPKAVRAVASACANNKISLLIPCHRIIHKDGSISGYRWDIKRKRALLKKEGAI